MGRTGTKDPMPAFSNYATSPSKNAAGASLLPGTLAAWRDDAIRHGFLGRAGGVSRGKFASLNFSYLVGDDSAAVDANWRRLRADFPAGTEFALLRQVHGNQVHRVTRQTACLRPDGDGMVTSDANVMLGILSADCIPILLIDRYAGVAGALHAGWKGVMADVAGNGIAAMAALGARPERIQAALGPAIGWCCFEVDDDLARRFAATIAGSSSHIRAGGPGKGYIDLKGIVKDQLERTGVAPQSISEIAACTRCESARYFSRRAAGGKLGGLQLSFVGLSG